VARVEPNRVYLHAQLSFERTLRYARAVRLNRLLLDLGAVPNLGILDDSPRLEAVLDTVSRQPLEIVLHGDFRHALAATDRAMRAAAVHKTRREVALANRLGAALIVHPSPNPGVGVPLDRKRAMHYFIDSLDELKADLTTATLVVENLPDCPAGDRYESTLSRPSEILAFVEQCPTVELAFDVGHANVGGWDPVELFERVASRVRFLALNDNLGDADAHLLPGRGNVDFRRLARSVTACDWQGGVIVEARRGGALHQHRAAWSRLLLDS
jgi:sugar phosphate isomerase/epimerase